MINTVTLDKSNRTSSSRKTKIGMVQINNSFSGQNYLPLSIGFLCTYASEYAKNFSDYEFLLPIYKRVPLDIAIKHLQDADIVCFSTYVWNFRISCEIAKRLKEHNNSITILFGGCHVPDSVEKGLERFVRKNKFIDFASTGEGERVFSSFLENYPNKTWINVPSLAYLEDDVFVMTPPAARIENLNEIPSPFLTGYFDNLMQSNPSENWIGLFETNRGCPFKCFEENTKIITSRCPNKKTKDIKVGDFLIAFDEETHELTETEVIDVHSREDANLIQIIFEDKSCVRVTSEHPFYIKDQWVIASEIKVGDEIYDITPRDKISFNKKVANPAKRAEVRDRISKTVADLYRNGFRSRFFEEGFQNKYRWSNSEELEDFYKRHSERMKTNNPMYDEGVRTKATNTLKKHIDDGTVVPYMCTEKYWQKLKNSPNKLEKEFLSLLQIEFGNRYEFTGNGSSRIGFYAPDFLDEKNKKIIELNGCYWHNCPQCFPESLPLKRDQDRITKFEKVGYKVLVVWSHELKDINATMKRIRTFSYNGKKVVAIEKIHGNHKVINFSCSPYQNYFANYVLSHNCTFCDWGTNSKNRMSDYDLEKRLFLEIEWFAKKGVSFVYCCDANFGMYKRDFDIATQFALMKKQHGFPERFSVQNTKNSSESSYKIQRVLVESGLDKGVLLAFQSLYEPTLKAVKRQNIKLETFFELQKRFTEDGVRTFSDIILGLPLETYDTFTTGVSTLIKKGQHNRIQFNNLSILPNAPMVEDIKEFGLEVIETRIINIHGSLSETEEVYETQQLVVGTNTLSKEEWIEARAFGYIAALLHFDKLIQIPNLLLNYLYGVSYKTIFDAFLHADSDNFPTIASVVNGFLNHAKNIQCGGAEYCESTKWLNIWWPADELALIHLATNGSLDAFYQESYEMLKSLGGEEDILLSALELNKSMIKLPFQTEDCFVSSNHNIYEMYRDVLISKSPVVKKGLYKYKILRSAENWISWTDWCERMVWYGNKKGDYLYEVIET